MACTVLALGGCGSSDSGESTGKPLGSGGASSAGASAGAAAAGTSSANAGTSGGTTGRLGGVTQAASNAGGLSSTGGNTDAGGAASGGVGGGDGTTQTGGGAGIAAGAEGGIGGGGASSAGAANGGIGGGGASSAGAANGGSMGGDAGAEQGGAGGVAANCTVFVMPDDCTVPDGAVLPGELRCTGLYGDWDTRELACGVQEYAPAFGLWSDAATKRRYVWLPPGETIDLSNPNEFIYPVGTLFWKQFAVGTPGDQTVGETRLLKKTDLGWIYTTYVWSEDGATAVQQNDGVDDLFNTGHSVPSREQCKACHGGRTDYVLGWDFVMLGEGATGVTRESLLEAGRFSGLEANADRLTQAMALTVPGDEVEKAALGYLHSNCGISCHNDGVYAAGRPSGLFLRLEVDELSDVHSTDAVSSGVNRAPGPNAELVGLPQIDVGYLDFAPLDADRSLAVARMAFRGSPAAMPPLGTHQVDEEGLATITAWINHMTAERGYPAAPP